MRISALDHGQPQKGGKELRALMMQVESARKQVQKGGKKLPKSKALCAPVGSSRPRAAH